MSHNNNDYYRHNEAIINYEQELRQEQINSNKYLIDYNVVDLTTIHHEFDLTNEALRNKLKVRLF